MIQRCPFAMQINYSDKFIISNGYTICTNIEFFTFSKALKIYQKTALARAGQINPSKSFPQSLN
jgi:hypothetical protein